MKGLVVFGISTLSTIILIILFSIFYFQYTKTIGGYLERAAVSNTIELAKENLEEAIKEIERQKLTSGTTEIFFFTPAENDISFWYKNLKSADEELIKIEKSNNSSPLEVSNVLLKLRETLLNDKKQLNDPDNISSYPYHRLLNILLLLSCAGFVVGSILSKLNN